MPKVSVDKPRRSNVNLSYINRFSAAPGLLYPVVIDEAFPADHFHYNFHAQIKTKPLNSILMGSFKVQFDTFFCPIRYYHRYLHDDRTDFDPKLVYFPQIRQVFYGPNASIRPANAYNGIAPSSLDHFLGIPEYFVWAPENSTYVYRYFNGIPKLAYFDIFRSYYANTQEENFRFIGANTADGSIGWYSAPLRAIDDMRQTILTHPADEPLIFDTGGTGSTSPYGGGHCHYELGGLICRTFLPDRFSVWVNTDKYQATLDNALVNTSAGSFNIDQLRLAEKLNKMLQKTLVAGGRYSDWSYVQYGTSMRQAIEAPVFVGTYSTEVVFEDVVQTSDAGLNEDPLGTLGARGRSYRRNMSHSYYVRENGYMITIMSIIPRVDYFQGTRYYMRHTNLGGLHVPTLDNIGFQDLLVDEFYSNSTTVDSNGFINNEYSVGRQPAYTELMTKVNELHGEFASDQSHGDVGLSTLVLQRTFYSPEDDILNPVYFTSYIDPSMFNYAFADASLSAQNFWVQLKVDCVVKRAISKAVMPHL